MNIVGIAGTASKWNHQDGLMGDIDRVIDAHGRDHDAPLEGHGILEPYHRPSQGGRGRRRDAQRTHLGRRDQPRPGAPRRPLHRARIRFFDTDTQDNAAYACIKNTFRGDFDMWVDDRSTLRGTYASPTGDTIIKGWHEENADGHGALGDYLSDPSGDSAAVFRFLNGDQNDPSKEGWGGEFVKSSNRYWVDAISDSLDLNRPGTDGAMAIHENRDEWMGDLAGRFDGLKDDEDGGEGADTVSVRVSGDA